MNDKRKVWGRFWSGRTISPEDTGNMGIETRECWVNDVCQALVYEYETPEGWPDAVYLSFRLNSREEWHDWRDFQRLKSDLCGTSCWGIESYPSQNLMVDTANQYHMFVFEPNAVFPIRLSQVGITDYSKQWEVYSNQAKEIWGEEKYNRLTGKAKQRPWEEYHKCDDLPLVGPVWLSRGWKEVDGKAVRNEMGNVRISGTWPYEVLGGTHEK